MELTEAEVRGKSERAQRLAASDDFQEFLADAKARIIDEWINGDTVSGREAAHAKLRGLADLLAVMSVAEGEAAVLDYRDAKVKRTPLAQPTEK